MTVHLDLRRDLPKLQKRLPKMLRGALGGKCEYAQPCAVGVMVNPKKRKWLDDAPLDDTQIDTLIDEGFVTVPSSEQKRDLRALQSCFDMDDGEGLSRLVDQLARKYLAPEPQP